MSRQSRGRSQDSTEDFVRNISYDAVESDEHVCGACSEKACKCWQRVFRLSLEIEQTELETVDVPYRMVATSSESDNQDIYIHCENCRWWCYGPEYNLTQEDTDNIDKFYCGDCIEANPNLKVTYFKIPGKRKKPGRYSAAARDADIKSSKLKNKPRKSRSLDRKIKTEPSSSQEPEARSTESSSSSLQSDQQYKSDVSKHRKHEADEPSSTSIDMPTAPNVTIKKEFEEAPECDMISATTTQTSYNMELTCEQLETDIARTLDTEKPIYPVLFSDETSGVSVGFTEECVSSNTSESEITTTDHPLAAATSAELCGVAVENIPDLKNKDPVECCAEKIAKKQLLPVDKSAHPVRPPGIFTKFTAKLFPQNRIQHGSRFTFLPSTWGTRAALSYAPRRGKVRFCSPKSQCREVSRFASPRLVPAVISPKEHGKMVQSERLSSLLKKTRFGDSDLCGGSADYSSDNQFGIPAPLCVVEVVSEHVDSAPIISIQARNASNGRIDCIDSPSGVSDSAASNSQTGGKFNLGHLNTAPMVTGVALEDIWLGKSSLGNTETDGDVSQTRQMQANQGKISGLDNISSVSGQTEADQAMTVAGANNSTGAEMENADRRDAVSDSILPIIMKGFYYPGPSEEIESEIVDNVDGSGDLGLPANLIPFDFTPPELEEYTVEIDDDFIKNYGSFMDLISRQDPTMTREKIMEMLNDPEALREAASTVTTILSLPL